MVVFTIEVFNRLIKPCPPLIFTSGLALLPNTLNASVTEIFEAPAVAAFGVIVTALFGVVILMHFGAMLLDVPTVFGAGAKAVFAVTVFEAIGRAVTGVLALGNGVNTTLPAGGSKGDDTCGSIISCCCWGKLKRLLLSATLGELNAISTSLGTSIFDASSSKESSSLFEIVSSLSSDRPSMSIKSSSWGTAGGMAGSGCIGAAVNVGPTTGAMGIGWCAASTSLFTTGLMLRKSSNPADDEDDENESLAPVVSVALRASARMSSLCSSNTDITGDCQCVQLVRPVPYRENITVIYRYYMHMYVCIYIP